MGSSSGGGNSGAANLNPAGHVKRWLGRGDERDFEPSTSLARANDVGTQGIGKNPANQRTVGDGYSPIPTGGLPFEPNFTSILNEGGRLKNPYHIKTDMSPWVTMQQNLNNNRATSAISEAGIGADVATGNAASSLAQTGGVDAGARERLFGAGEMARMGAAADIRGQANDANLQADLTGQQMSMDAQRANVQNAISGVAGQNVFDMAKYGEQMKGYAANKTGIALEKSGKK